MNTIELFAGTQSFSKVMRKHGHNTFTVDINEEFGCDATLDVLRPSTNLTGYERMTEAFYEADMVWMSPPCTTFSIASGNTHWTANRKPKTKEAEEGLRLLEFCKYVAIKCIENNKIFFIENPNGRAVWFLPDKWLKRVWYCQYGDTRAKPTNIWTNLNNWTPKTCKNGNPYCHHERAPRGSKTGTQGLKGAKERSVIPSQLFEEILEVMNDVNKE